MPMKRENGRVLIDLTEEDYELLLIMMGYAAAGGVITLRRAILLLNSINQGNPHFVPYEIPEEVAG